VLPLLEALARGEPCTLVLDGDGLDLTVHVAATS